MKVRDLLLLPLVLSVALASAATAGTIRVPADQPTIAAALEAAAAGDVVLVSAGTYRERVRLKAGVVLRSAGDDAPGKLGLLRAERTVIDGDAPGAAGAGVEMAEQSTLDGFTVTGVGKYDEQLWNRHHATLGEEQPHEHIGAPGTAGVAVTGVASCTVANNIVHHIGYTGIAVVGAEGRRVSPRIAGNVAYRNMGGGIGSMKGSTAVIEGNTCFQNYYAGIGHDDAGPRVVGNRCYENIRAGIGISEGACPVVRGNRCYRNRRAGIGVRTGAGTRPVVEGNECYENEMAGIGSRDGARPVIRGNRCYKNRMAGIGVRSRSRAVVEENECFENEMAGIGARLDAAPLIRGNRCYKNQMAGIGAREGARPLIEDNECYENAMAGIGVREQAAPTVRGNRCYRNAMAGIGARLGARPAIDGNYCHENEMAGIGVREGATPLIRDNRCEKNALAGIGSRRGARPTIVGNRCLQNQQAGIGVRDQQTRAIIINNQCLENRLVAIGLPDGAAAVIQGNKLVRTGGGAPPLVAIKGGSNADFCGNHVQGGGVAGVLVEGAARIHGNRFVGKGPGQGSAVWVWPESQVVVTDNQFSGYRNAVNASGARVAASGNTVRQPEGPAIVVRKPSHPPRVFGNRVISDDAKAGVQIDGEAGAEANVIVPVQKDAGEAGEDAPWDAAADEPVDWRKWVAEGVSEATLGEWRLQVLRGDQGVAYRLLRLDDDPETASDHAARLPQIAFRLQGLAERVEAAQYGRKMKQ